MKGLKHNGEISQDSVDAWSTMVSRSDYLSYASNRLATKPPDYVSIVGPPLSGRSTFIRQLEQEWEAPPSPLVFAIVDLLNIGSGSTQQCDLALAKDVIASVGRKLGDFNAPNVSEFNDQWSDFSTENFDLVNWLAELVGSLPDQLGLALVLENVRPTAEYDKHVLAELSSIYSRRMDKGLSRFTAITSSTLRLSVDYGSQVSPFNDAQEIELVGLTKEETLAFLQRVGKKNGCTFTQNAVDYLHAVTNGDSALISDIVSKINPERDSSVALSDIQQALSLYLYSPNRFSNLILNKSIISKQSEEVISELLQNRPVIGFHSKDGVAEVVRLGLARTTISNRCVFRSEVVKWLCELRFGKPIHWDGVSHLSSLLVQLPPVRCTIFDDVFRTKVFTQVDELLRRETVKAREGMLFAAVRDQINSSSAGIEFELVHKMLELVWEKSDGPVPSLADIRDYAISLVAQCWMNRGGLHG